MKKFIITYKKPYKKAELWCTVYAWNELLAVASFKLTHPLCTIINMEEEQ